MRGKIKMNEIIKFIVSVSIGVTMGISINTLTGTIVLGSIAAGVTTMVIGTMLKDKKK